MQPWMLFIVVAVLAHQAATSVAMSPWLQGPPLLLAYALPKIVLAVAWAIRCQRWRRQRQAGQSNAKWWRAYARAAERYRYAIIVLLISDLAVGVLLQLRRSLNDPILLDEALILVGPLLLTAWGLWWGLRAEQRPQPAAVAQPITTTTGIEGPLELDQPALPEQDHQPPAPAHSRIVLGRMRDLCVPVLLPVGMLYGWWELFEHIHLPITWLSYSTVENLILSVRLVGVVLLFAMMPEFMRRAMNTQPLPEDARRSRIAAVLAAQAIAVRDVLIWHTSHGRSAAMALVLGVAKPWRYLVLTEGLIDHLTPAQLEAVIAHEGAHIQQRHSLWLMLTAFAILGLIDQLWQILLLGLTSLASAFDMQSLTAALSHNTSTGMLIESAVIAGAWFYCFGKALRQIERHADATAVATLARIHATAESQNAQGIPLIQTEHGQALAGALGMLASVNGMNPNRSRWGYDSIAIRQQKALALVSQPINHLAIDRAITLMKRAAIAVLIALAVLQLL